MSNNIKLTEETIKKLSDSNEYARPDDSELKNKLTELEYDVTQNGNDEKPFTGEYVDT